MKKKENTKRLKIAVIEPIGGHGGNEFYDFGLCEALSLTHDVVLFTCDETSLHKRFPLKTKVREVYRGIYGKSPAIIKGLRYVKGTISSLFYCIKNRVDVVHLHIYRFALWERFNLLLFKLFRFKVVATVHDIEPFARYGEEVRIDYNSFLKHLDAIVVHTHYSLQYLSHLLNEKNRKKVRKVQNGDIDFVYKKSVSKKEARERLNLPVDATIILFFGQIKKVKGLDVLIKAFNIVGKRLSDVYLLIVGRPWKINLEDYVGLIDDSVKDRVILRPEFIPDKDVFYYFAATDIVVLPYKKIYNSSVILRAFDYGSAVIASDLDTFKEFIKEGKTGYLFKSEDAESLAEKIVFLISSPKKIETVKNNAKKFIEQNFSKMEINLQMNKVFKEILNKDF